jgi:hypothetical protein
LGRTGAVAAGSSLSRSVDDLSQGRQRAHGAGVVPLDRGSLRGRDRQGDIKLRHLARDPECVLVVFEAVRPFRGVEVRGVGELVEGDVTAARAAIAGRYLGVGDGERFAAERRSRPGVLLRLVPDSPRVWDLSGILPT